ncbi:UNVERIFIED_CONTAM: Zinc finger CCCH domain-containing protein 24 [Sesamum angustifolium]|uniref:Zinc finger CCCH domain-containing protein 24 n=1 Tax=Sesamum angustifolium TaxID=2727405 RepID=A0AAW2QQ70_9LAMI
MDHQDSSSDPPVPSEDPSPSSHVDTNLAEKRKREPEPEPEPDPETSSHPAPPPQHPLWKTSLCSYFRRTGDSCSHGESCRYAHGEAELRPRPDNTWDPTSERAKKMARTEEKEKEEAAEDGGVMMTDALDVEGEESSSDGYCSSTFQLLNGIFDGLLFKSAKKKKGMTVGFVSFENVEQVKIAVKELDGKSVGNNRTLKVADVIPRPFEKNNKPIQKSENPSLDGDHTNMTDGDGDGSLVPSGSVVKGRSVRDVVTPLAHMTYSDQLDHKKNSLAQTLKRLTRNARKACPNGVSLPEWILNSREIGGLPCKLEGIIESPLVNGYRNKCEFSVGCSLQGKHTVGFLLGNFREGVTAVQEPVDCPNVSRIACRYATVFQEFLLHSLLPVWNRLNNTGFWRQLTVREGRRPCTMTQVEKPEASIAEVMLIVQVCTKGFDDGQIKDEIECLAREFSVGSTVESPPLPLTALVIQSCQFMAYLLGLTLLRTVGNPRSKIIGQIIREYQMLRHLMHRCVYVFINKGADCGLELANDVAEPRIHDYISNLRFSISPSAFFQVNTLAAEKLYSLAGDWAGLGPDTLLFDVCCGTGTIGLTLAHRVGMVVGIEMNASAVSDAQRNAEINGIKNCRFVCGKAEDVIGSLMKEYLSLPHKQDETSEMSESKESEVVSADENISSADSVTRIEDKLSVEHENGSSAGKCSKDEAQLEKHCTLESSTPVQQFKNVVAIVDPPRVGLHPTVSAIEAFLCTDALVSGLPFPSLKPQFSSNQGSADTISSKEACLLSCNPESLVANAIELCTPSLDKTEKGTNKNNRGWKNMSSAGLARHRAKSMPNSEPFKPVKAMAVDLFPHTPHCELVMLLER